MVPLTEPDGILGGSPCQRLGCGAARVGEGLSDKAHRRCSAGRRIGGGQLPAQHKSIAVGCLLPGVRAIALGQEPELRDAGVSRFAENGSHLEVAPATDAAGVRVGGPGSSEFAKNGSHLAATDFSDEPWAFMWRRPHIAPCRIRPSVVRDGLAGQFGTENGPVVYARLISAPGPHAAVAAAQVVM